MPAATQSFARYRSLIAPALRHHLPQGDSRCAAGLNRAIEFAIFPGGKRLRPVLSLMAAEVANCDLDAALPAACAVEFLHTSSLIFDDLPAMDDAAMRRGCLSLHLRFGEDMAILAALALLNRAYAIFGAKPKLLAEAASCIGECGMIGGQSIDLEQRSPGAFAADETSFTRRDQKTAALMRLTLTAGALASGASCAAVEALACCGTLLGEAYQICDDLLDQLSPGDATGKTACQDTRHGRPSHLSEFGVAGSLGHAAQLISDAKMSLRREFGDTQAVASLVHAMDGIVEQLTAPLMVAQ